MLVRLCANATLPWISAELSAVRVAQHEAFCEARVLSSISDGTRLGDPAEENVFYVFWTP